MKIAIIGAGCAGLVSSRFCIQSGHQCDVFEQTGLPGGIWNYTEKIDSDENGLPVHSAMYKDLRTNLPKELMTLTDFPYPSQRTSFISQPEVLDYLRKYADKFELHPNIKYYRLVKEVEPIENGRWKLKIHNVKTKEEVTVEYDAVMVCNGHYTKISMPDIPGMEAFKGKQLHSKLYRTAEPFEGLRVLLIGAGPSGQDIALKVADVAQEVIISHRFKFPVVLPPKILQKPVVKDIEDYEITFDDGTKKIVDAIIYCTGYKYSFPFLSEGCAISVDNNWIKYLYKHIINVNHPTMGFIGICFNNCPFPVCDLQARFFLSYLNKGFTLPSRSQMIKEIEDDLASKDWKKKYAHLIGEKQKIYSEDVAKTGNITPLPDVVHKLFFHVRENRNPEDCFRIVNDETFEQI